MTNSLTFINLFSCLEENFFNENIAVLSVLIGNDWISSFTALGESFERYLPPLRDIPFSVNKTSEPYGQ